MRDEEIHRPFDPAAQRAEQRFAEAVIHALADLQLIGDARLFQRVRQNTGIDAVAGMVVVSVEEIGRREPFDMVFHIPVRPGRFLDGQAMRRDAEEVHVPVVANPFPGGKSINGYVHDRPGKGIGRVTVIGRAPRIDKVSARGKTGGKVMTRVQVKRSLPLCEF